MSTALWVVRDALVTVFAAVDAEVFPGPRPRTANPKKFVLVGSDGGDTGMESTQDGLTEDQEASDLGPGGWRDATGSIVCAAWAWSGNSSVTSSETDARAVFDQCEDVIAADPTLGGVLTAGRIAEIASVAARESLLKTGPFVRIAFGVNYSALLTA